MWQAQWMLLPLRRLRRGVSRGAAAATAAAAAAARWFNHGGFQLCHSSLPNEFTL